ncbi:MAG: tyrosine-type recombinase/integrase [Bacteroidia bacterium]|jgi:integrase/recombinase XerC|nr:tyrosine-type recombinase/integrase [Bacteroidia bacterium]
MNSEYDTFISYLKHEKRYSAHTVLAYDTDIKQFLDFLLAQYQITSPSEASHFIIRSWIVSLMEEKLDPRSVNRKITTLRTLYRYLVRQRIIQRNPMLKVQAPKTKKKLPEYVDEEKMERLLDPSMEVAGDFQSVRNFLMVDFFYRTGVRLSELIGLKVSDVNLFSLTVTVLGKRNKVRQIPITNSFKIILKNYLELRTKFLAEVGGDSPHFFLGNNGNQMYPGFVYRTVKSSISLVSTGKKRSPHILRHSFATAMLNHGADINAIKEILGHSSLAATQVYTHNSIEKLKEVYKQAFPKA